MSRNPSYDALLEELRAVCARPHPCYDTAQTWADSLTEQITCKMLATYESKDTDYASNGLPMGNLRVSEELGIPAWKAVLLRISDKLQRTTSFVARGAFAVDDEKITDTLVDMANYALLGCCLFDEMYPDAMGAMAQRCIGLGEGVDTIAWLADMADFGDLHQRWDWSCAPYATHPRVCFFAIGVWALRCKILHELGLDAWTEEPFSKLQQAFGITAHFAARGAPRLPSGISCS